ncbi:hypothetical protein PENSPDRAFT_685782 [Peniophora sp. CONT]|nr:hypothetical protein PENSPDRAFT_685782 [Peniophora sp. CONT]
MSFPLFFSLLSLFWLALHRFVKPSTRARSLLPSHALTRRTHSEITLKGVHLRYEYTGLNGAHAAWSRWLADERHAILRRVAVGFYECGVALGVLGMVLAVGLMGRTAMNLTETLLFPKYDYDSTTNTTVAINKRTFVDDAPPQSPAATSPASALDVHLLIPGVTLPWSAVLPLFLALAFAQAFHEAGHAICAALDRIQLSSTGFSLTLIIPAFFVALPTPLPARSAPRIAAAGALHNLLLFVIFSIPLSSLWTADVSLQGAGIVSVEGDAYDGLADVLSVGDIVASLDDFSLAGGGAEAWETYFSRPTYTDDLGWCIDAKALEAQSTTSMCKGGTILFVMMGAEDGGERQALCLDPVPILAGPSAKRRCPCNTGDVCLRPASEPPIMRITLDNRRIVLWRGPKGEVYEQVMVADRLPRFGGGPLGLGFALTEGVGGFAMYVRALTLSLFLFNLLPLPRLDGAQLLDALLDLWATRRESAKEVELDDVERGNNTVSVGPRSGTRTKDGRAAWARHIERVVQGTAVGLLVSQSN